MIICWLIIYAFGYNVSHLIASVLSRVYGELGFCGGTVFSDFLGSSILATLKCWASYFRLGVKTYQSS